MDDWKILHPKNDQAKKIVEETKDMEIENNLEMRVGILTGMEWIKEE